MERWSVETEGKRRGAGSVRWVYKRTWGFILNDGVVVERL